MLNTGWRHYLGCELNGGVSDSNKATKVVLLVRKHERLLKDGVKPFFNPSNVFSLTFSIIFKIIL